PPKDKKILTTAVNLWTRHLVIRQCVEDFQLGIESYQTQLNLTKPRWDATGFEYKHDYTVIDSSRAVTFRDKYGVQMIMRCNEIHKFSDVGFNSRVHSLRALSTLRCSSLRTASAAANQVNLKSVEISDLNANLQEQGVKPSNSASGSQPSSNTKKNKIQRLPNRLASLQHFKLNANLELICVKCNGYMLSDNHDLCVPNFINDVNVRAKSKSVKKNSKRILWKPTGKVFTKIRYIWRPTGRTFTIIGNASPLTRITTTIEVPSWKPIALETNTPKPVVTLFLKKPRKSKTTDPVCKSKVIKSVSANKKEPNKSWGSTDSNIPSFSLDECRSRGNNVYTMSLRDMMASSPICLLSKASKTKSWLGTETLHEYYEKVGISHETSFARSPQQNEAVATACYTQNRSIIRLCHGKTPYELLHDKLPDLSFFYVFCVDHPAPKVIAPIAEVVALEPTASAGSPSSTTVDQDAPSPSNSQTTPETHTPIISNDEEEDNYNLDVAHMHNDPFFGNIRQTHTPYESVGRWTKDHPIANVIGDPSRFVSTRMQVQTDAMWCFFDAFLTSVKPKNFKQAITKPSWIDAMPEEIHEFERLEVWELVSCPDKVLLIKLQWIYKVKTDEFGEVLNNKERLVAQGFRQDEGIDFEESFASVARI
nr:Gag-Pol polyprotein [Tanacetum cinerariifolium]